MRERMMFCRILLFVFVVAEHWEVHNPQKRMTLTLDAESISHMQTKSSKNRICHFIRISSKEQQVAWLSIGCLFDLCISFIIEELNDRALFLTIRSKGNPSHTLSTICCSNISKLLDLATAPVASTLCINALNQAARLSNA